MPPCIQALIEGYVAGLLTAGGVLILCAIIWRIIRGTEENR